MRGNPPVGLNRGRVHREENVGLDYRWHREIPTPPGTRFPTQKVATIGVADLHLVSMRIRIRIWGLDDKIFRKFTAENLIFFRNWIHSTYPQALIKDVQAKGEASRPQEKRTPSDFCGSFLLYWIRISISNSDPDTDPANPKINSDPDPQHCSSVFKIYTLRLQRHATKKFTTIGTGTDRNGEMP